MQGDKTISEFHITSTIPGPYDFIKIGLSRDRKELYRLIEERVDKMIEAGLLHETKNLLEMKPDRTALQALGYKDLGRYLQGDIKLEEAVRLIKKHTKMYAKRQITWFKKEPDITWIDVTGISDADKIFTRMISEVDLLRKIIENNAMMPDI